jgi:hypothetical protein
MNRSEEIQNLSKAMSNLQSEIKDAEKDTAGYNYKYADLAQVLSLIRPLLLKNGLSFTQHVSNADGSVVIETVVMHESGQWMASELNMPPTPSSKMSPAQAVGSAITYGRRYALTAIFGITQQAEDDDAAADHSKHEQRSQQKHTPPKAAQTKPKPYESIDRPLNDLQNAVHADDKGAGYKTWMGLSKETKTAVWNKLTPEEKAWVQSLKPDYSQV